MKLPSALHRAPTFASIREQYRKSAGHRIRDFIDRVEVRLKPVFKYVFPNFIAVHYAYIISMTLLSSILLYPVKNQKYIDCLFLSAGATTQGGLNTTDVNKMTLYQQIVIYIICTLSTPIIIHSALAFVRLYWFERYFDGIRNFSKKAYRMRRTRTLLSRELSRQNMNSQSQIPTAGLTSSDRNLEADHRHSNQSSSNDSFKVKRFSHIERYESDKSSQNSNSGQPHVGGLHFVEPTMAAPKSERQQQQQEIHPFAKRRNTGEIAPVDMYRSIAMLRQKSKHGDLVTDDESGPALIVQSPGERDKKNFGDLDTNADRSQQNTVSSTNDSENPLNNTDEKGLTFAITKPVRRLSRPHVKDGIGNYTVAQLRNRDGSVSTRKKFRKDRKLIHSLSSQFPFTNSKWLNKNKFKKCFSQELGTKNLSDNSNVVSSSSSNTISWNESDPESNQEFGLEAVSPSKTGIDPLQDYFSKSDSPKFYDRRPKGVIRNPFQHMNADLEDLGVSNMNINSSSHSLPNSMSNNYLSYQPTIGRNSVFVGLNKSQKDELGGVEYRAIKFLCKLLVVYYLGFHVMIMAFLVPWICLRHTYTDLVKDDGVTPVWWGFFTSMSAFNDLGLTLTPDSMISFKTATFPLIVMMFFIIIGNTGFPVMLRFIIWILHKIVPDLSQSKENLAFLLDHPRRCFTLLFPNVATWWLFISLFGLNALDLILFIVLDINAVVLNGLSAGYKVLDGLFQAVSTRTAGFSIVDLSQLHPAIQVSYMMMMYISVLPLAISIRRTNVYEEQSLGRYRDSSDTEDISEENTSEGSQDNSTNSTENESPIVEKIKSSEKSFIAAHLRRQLSFDIWFIFLGLFIICICEGGKLQDPTKPSFTVFAVLFEIVSAYGTVGLSLGYPNTNQSFSAQFTTISKLVIIAMLIRGRHRGLPYAIDRAIILPSDRLEHIDHVEEMNSTHRNNDAPSPDAINSYLRRKSVAAVQMAKGIRNDLRHMSAN